MFQVSCAFIKFVKTQNGNCNQKDESLKIQQRYAPKDLGQTWHRTANLKSVVMDTEQFSDTLRIVKGHPNDIPNSHIWLEMTG